MWHFHLQNRLFVIPSLVLISSGGHLGHQLVEQGMNKHLVHSRHLELYKALHNSICEKATDRSLNTSISCSISGGGKERERAAVCVSSTKCALVIMMRLVQTYCTSFKVPPLKN